MAGPTVYTHVAAGSDTVSDGHLFTGKRFWVAQRVPSRVRLLDDIKANGGEIVVLEKKADYRIADHFRLDCPPGTISYTFIEKSIKEGELQDPADHPAGPRLGEARESGSTRQPTKSGRAAYTAEEDRILYKWVRDAEARGAQVGGNEIYKQLEAKYPRHPWQSWRHRYLKHLKNRPPSAFNIPDNAPPSPPSDQSNKHVTPVPVSPKPAKQQAPKIEHVSDATKISRKGKLKPKGDYSVEELEGMFDVDDWLECYAFVETIDDLKGTDRWEPAWAAWAQHLDKQTAEQWKQYYEKVVHPQWLRDPISKREKIKKHMERKLDGTHANRSQTTGEQSSELGKPDEMPSGTAAREKVETGQPSGCEEKRFEELLQDKQNDRLFPAYTLYALEKKQDALNAQPAFDHVALHELLLAQWRSLSTEEKAPYIAKDQSATKDTSNTLMNPAKHASDIKTLSYSTARPESPNFYADQYKRSAKRLREYSAVEREEEIKLAPSTKRRKSGSATPTQEDPVSGKAVGTENQPFEISSAESSQSTSQSDEEVEELVQEQLRSEALDAGDDDTTMVNLDGDSEEKEVESIESDDFPEIDYLHAPPLPEDETGSGDDLPSNTPTPRAARQKFSNFDTQAILFSPILHNVPRAQGHAYDVKPQQSSSPFQHPESDASTTQSLEEFRRSLQEHEEVDPDQPPPSHLPPPPFYPSSSPTPSSVSTNSADPDPPLTGNEILAFYEDRNKEGWSDDFISKALKRTGLRPDLAVTILEEWKVGKPLPIERGIWSIEDDAAVEGGDGLELAKLAEKHSLDGWGGIIERLKFLECYRSR